MKKSPLVKYSNHISRSCQRLNLIEQRIVLSALSQSPPDKNIDPTDTFFISAAEYAELSEEKELSHAYRDLKEGAKSLLRRFVTLAERDQEGKKIGEIEFNWLSAGKYIEQEGKVGISFNPYMIPYISVLRKHFTKFELKEITAFRSAYSQPLYVRLMMYMRDPADSSIKQSWVDHIEVEELKVMLGATNYTRFFDLKRRVLDPVCKQINESPHTKFTVSWEPFKKERKKVLSLEFTMKLKPHVLELPGGNEKDILDMFSGLSDRQATLTDKQLSMYADWLSGSSKPKTFNGDFEKFVGQFHGYLAHTSRLQGHSPNHMQAYRGHILGLLCDPQFIHQIYHEYLKPLGFNPAGK